jgi:hypothetical protein
MAGRIAINFYRLQDQTALWINTEFYWIEILRGARKFSSAGDDDAMVG